MLAYDEPRSAAEMQARYAAIRRKLYEKRSRHGIPEHAEVIILRECNAHVATWLRWRLAKEAGMTDTECQVLFDSHKTPPISVDNIISEEAAKAGITPEDIRGRRRKRHICNARQAAMARAYVERPDLSLPQIGRMFGNRDHTTVLHAAKKCGVHVQCKVGTPGRP